MSNDLAVFDFSLGDCQLRVVGNADCPEFVGVDVCRALGFKNPNRAMQTHCKGPQKLYTLQTAGGPQSLRVLTESDMLRLVCGAHTEPAAKFEKWVFEEVLPTIRKHGAYIDPKTLDQLMGNPDLGLELFKRLKEEQDKYRLLHNKHEETKAELAKLTTDLLKKDSEVVELNKHAEFSKKFRQSKDLMLVRHFAALMSQAFVIKFGQKAAFEWLIKHKFMTKDHFPSAYAIRHGLLAVNPGTREHRDGSPAITYVTKITPKGCGYFFDKLQDEIYGDGDNAECAGSK